METSRKVNISLLKLWYLVNLPQKVFPPPIFKRVNKGIHLMKVIKIFACKFGIPFGLFCYGGHISMGV